MNDFRLDEVCGEASHQHALAAALKPPDHQAQHFRARLKVDASADGRERIKSSGGLASRGVTVPVGSSGGRSSTTVYLGVIALHGGKW